MLKHVFTILISLILSAVVGSCGDSKEDGPVQIKSVHRTVLVYMIADNNLGTHSRFDEADINEMLIGVKGNALNGGRLIVYRNRPGTDSGNPPQLIEITEDGTKILKTYPDDPSIYSVEVSRMREVLSDVESLAPADEFGLVFWGHATSWLTESGDIPEDLSSKKRSYGHDRYKWMSLGSLAKALEDRYFRFIYFDCCLMGTVEVAYELRHVAPVIVASPTELEGEGMPYHLNVPVFFAKGVPDMIKAASNTFEYYNGRHDSTCQMVVVDTSALDRLAEVSRIVLLNLTSYPQWLDKIQPLSKSFTSFNDPYYNVFRNTRPVYDMKEYMVTLASQYSDELLKEWQAAFESAVVYKSSTKFDFTGIEIKTYGGLGSFIIKRQEETGYRGYNDTQWWKDVVSAAPLFN